MLFKRTLVYNQDTFQKNFEPLYNLMGCPKNIAEIPSRTNDMNSIKWDEKQRLNRIKKHLNSKPIWMRLLGSKDFFEVISYLNGTPYHFEKTIAPFFFKNFPDGEIWFIEKNQDELKLFFQKEITFAESIFGNNQHPLLQQFPQNMSGLRIYDIIQDFGLTLGMILNYPEIYGSNAMTIWGNFLFIAKKPINMHKHYQINITDSLTGNLNLLYSDDRTVSSGPRPEIEYFNQSNFFKYMNWYIERVGLLMKFIYDETNLERFYLLSLSLSRICVETYLIQTSDSSFIRKVTFFNLLDKYANLIKQYSNTSEKESELWKKLVNRSTYETSIKEQLESIDDCVGSKFENRATAFYDDNILTLSMHLPPSSTLGDEDACDLLRAYRNSHHGYFLRQNTRELLLSHSGNISNALPDISIILWHAILENPKKFFNSFS